YGHGDTCCIDKDSSTELQEAIGSMFTWYRQSALAVEYLAEVPDVGSFSSSKFAWVILQSCGIPPYYLQTAITPIVLITKRTALC
ncbi:hypothetical protein BKA82DRAFT_3971325, partial [Pisolithus tinctorius]